MKMDQLLTCLKSQIKLLLNSAFLIFLFCASSFAQEHKVTGTVVGADDNAPIPGVYVLIKGQTAGTSTDANGNYSITVPNNETALVFSFIGYATQEIVVGANPVVNVSMALATTELSEIVVTAFGISRQSKALTYATQNVKTDALAEARTLNVMTGLSGKVSGMAITEAGTGVGADAKVLLRGNRSINGSSQPLYIVDGITLGGGIQNLSPDDIESMSVLKGANAAALYGSRANNGAIIITTKSGSKAKQGVSVNLTFAYQGSSAIILDKMQNEYGQGANGLYSPNAIVSWGAKMDGSQVAHWSNDPNYSMYGKTYAYTAQPDNVKDYFRRGNNLSTNLQVAINNGKSNAAFSYTFTDASGIVATNNLRSHNVNFRFGSQLSKKLTLDSKVNVIRQNFTNQFATGENFDNPMRYLYVLERNIRTVDIEHYEFLNEAGQNRQHYWRWNDNGTGNPYWSRYRVQRPEFRQRVISMISLKYEILDGLSILGRSAIDQGNTQFEFKRFNDSYTTAINGSYEKNNSSSYEWNSDVLLNYHKTISNFGIDLNAGANNKRNKYQQIGGAGAVFNIENLFSLANTGNPRPYENYTDKEVNSVYGFGEISFKNYLFLNLTGRNDWSSALPSDSRSYFYPSVGLTAVVSDMVSFPTALSYLKLRGSYAIVGNDTDPYRLYRTAQVGIASDGNAQSGVISLSNVMPNPNLKPETTKSLELGFDTRLIKDRIRLGLTWYKTNTYDQLFATPVPTTSGVASVFQNGADVQNKGVEITLGAAVVTTTDFSWDIDLNFSKNSSEILKIAEGFNVLSYGRDFIRDYQLRVGHPFGDVYAKSWARYGDDQTTPQREGNGEVIVQSNGLPVITSGMTELVANFNPDWLGGILNTFRYKNFSFSALIDIRHGGTFISITEAISAGSGVEEYTATGREANSLLFGREVFPMVTGVTSTGEPNTATTNAEAFWNNVGGRNNPAGGAFVRSASNIRMREMVLGYDLPKEIVPTAVFSSLRISIVGRNLFFIQNKAKYVDPEIMMFTSGTGEKTAEGESSFPLPPTRTYGISLNFGF
jgi:TonB-linked SusC/RagA family outer membrane protein